jgi:hypothetical protein
MPDWIADAAKRVEAERERRRKYEESQTAIDNSLRANVPAIFEALRGAVEKDVALFNTHFPDYTKKLKDIEPIGDNWFQVHRAYDPVYLLVVKLDRERCEIGWEVTQNELKSSGKFEIKYDDGGGRLLENGYKITFEDASRKLIEPAVEDTV